MQGHTNPQATGSPIGWVLSWPHQEARRLGAGIHAFLAICADAYAAAARYEELSKLSVQELERRGIPRGHLPQHIFEALTKR
jgi:hypothetical protein